MSQQIKVTLNDDELPKQWYNIQADLPHPLPPPVDLEGNPIGPDALAPVFPMNLIEQEVSTVFKMADRNYVLSSGKIIAEGTGEQLLQNEVLRKTYLGL